MNDNEHPQCHPKRTRDWWDRWFLGLAKYVSTASKDPSTRTGAVIVDASNRVVSVGYNGFPRGVEDTDERLNDRELKYKITVHCEVNAVLFAKGGCDGCTLYTYPFGSCSVCAAKVIQSGILRCVSPPLPESLRERWGKDVELAGSMFREAGVEVVVLLDP